MLFRYPLAATERNWLHDCLTTMIREIHVSIEAKEAPLAWPDIIPKAHRGKLEGRYGLRDKLHAYQQSFDALTQAERDQTIQAITQQNDLENLCESDQECCTSDVLAGTVKESAKELFEFAFKLLSELEIRDHQYKTIYENLLAEVCPFCGIENFESGDQSREDLDHYLAISKYPFAGTNLRNLIPMGDKCNRHHKGSIDILHKDNGSRRKVFDPYGEGELVVCLNESELFAGDKSYLPSWQINFQPDGEEVETWDRVFKIRARYKSSALDKSFKRWLNEFGKWAQIGEIEINDADTLCIALQKFYEITDFSGFHDKAFLKAAVIKMLRHHCQNGPESERVMLILRELATPPARAV